MGRPKYNFFDEKFQFAFWQKVKIQAGKCWLWSKGVESNGYGQQTVAGKNLLAHRVSYALSQNIAYEEIELDVLHKCDVKRCVNPDHLYLGTDSENAKDRVDRGKQVALVGSENPMTNLVESDILFIRENCKKRGDAVKLSKFYKVSGDTIRNIVKRKTWSHI